jgi:hypothetical protein
VLDDWKVKWSDYHVIGLQVRVGDMGAKGAAWGADSSQYLTEDDIG